MFYIYSDVEGNSRVKVILAVTQIDAKYTRLPPLTFDLMEVKFYLQTPTDLKGLRVSHRARRVFQDASRFADQEVEFTVERCVFSLVRNLR